MTIFTVATWDDVEPEIAERGRGVILEGGPGFYLSTGHRSLEEQWFYYNRMLEAQRLYKAKWRNYAPLAAYPGTSDHGKDPAAALDIACAEFQNKLRTELFRRWGLQRNVAGEPWHVVLHPSRSAIPKITKEVAMGIAIDPMGSVSHPTAGGWVVGRRGHVYAWGNAQHLGAWNDATRGLNIDCIALVPTASGNGYWLISAAGQIYAYGDAKFPGNYDSKAWGAGRIVGAFRNDRQPNGGVTLVRDDGLNLNLYALPVNG